ncbi:17306_t:CDS:2, partial [Rhizophagus irregularis]
GDNDQTCQDLACHQCNYPGFMLPDIGRKGSQLAVVHKRQDTRYWPKGVASHGGVQIVGRSSGGAQTARRKSTITTESGSQLTVVHKRQDTRYRPKGVASRGGAQTTGYQISTERGRKSWWCTNGRTKVNNHHGVAINAAIQIHAAKHWLKGVATNGCAQTGVGYC